MVRDQVRDKLAFSLEDMGEQQVKNIARPVRVHRIVLDEGIGGSEPPTKTSTEPALALPDKPSMAGSPHNSIAKGRSSICHDRATRRSVLIFRFPHGSPPRMALFLRVTAIPS
jgi:hypothetical protein